jgi:hypothetical protein
VVPKSVLMEITAVRSKPCSLAISAPIAACVRLVAQVRNQ